MELSNSALLDIPLDDLLPYWESLSVAAIEEIAAVNGLPVPDDSIPIYSQVIDLVKSSKMDVSGRLLVAAERGDLVAVKDAVYDGATNYNAALVKAVKGGHVDVVDYLVSLGASNEVASKRHYTTPLRPIHSVDQNRALTTAALNGNITAVGRLVDTGASDYDSALVAAASKGHHDIADFMISLGATSVNPALVAAAGGGHHSVVQLLIDNGASNLNPALTAAAGKGHRGVVTILINNGASDLNSALNAAASGGHAPIVKVLIDNGASSRSAAMTIAAREGHSDIAKLLLDSRR